MTRSSQNNNKKKKSAFNEMTAAVLSDMPGIYFVKFIRTFKNLNTFYSN